jgi:hypothetical protein
MPPRATRALCAVAAAALLGAAACGGAREGSGTPGAQEREVDDFTALSVSGDVDVDVRIGPGTSVTVRGDEDLLDELETDVKDETLEIDEERALRPRAGLLVVAQTPALEEIEVAGAGDVRVTGLRGEQLEIDVSGAGDVEVAGRVEAVDVQVSGAGDVRLLGLVAREADVEVSGAGQVDVTATESLTAQVSGAGHVRYAGRPSEVDTDVSGAGDVRPR